jgi:lysyl-tRNA synthetase class 2
MTRAPIKSSMLKSSGYDSKTKTLEVEFHDGSVYRYKIVPIEKALGFATAKSMGQFFQAHIRDKHSFTKA